MKKKGLLGKIRKKAVVRIGLLENKHTLTFALRQSLFFLLLKNRILSTKVQG